MWNGYKKELRENSLQKKGISIFLVFGKIIHCTFESSREQIRKITAGILVTSS